MGDPNHTLLYTFFGVDVSCIKTRQTCACYKLLLGDFGAFDRSLLDHHAQELDILGTVAGDDTLFVSPKSIQRIEANLSAIRKILYGGS